jgi:predicted P-loop ATPase
MTTLAPADDAGYLPTHDPFVMLPILRKLLPNEKLIRLTRPDGVCEDVVHPDWCHREDGPCFVSFWDAEEQPILFAPGQKHVFDEDDWFADKAWQVDRPHTLHILWKPKDMAAAKERLRNFHPKVAYAWADGETIVAVWELHFLPQQKRGFSPAGWAKPSPQLSRAYCPSFAGAETATAWLLKQFEGAESPEYVPAPGNLGCDYFIFDDEPEDYEVEEFRDPQVYVLKSSKREFKMKKPEDAFPCTRPNIQILLDSLGVAVAFDTFANKTMIAGLDDFGPALNDKAVNRLRFIAADQFNMKKPEKEFFHDALNDIAWENRFHPVCDYVDGLKWDGVKRLGDKDTPSWLTTYGRAEDNEYTRAVGPLQLIAAVRRVRQPGCKKDEMLTFESAQGLNKSSALKLLAVREEWFCDNFVLGRSARETMEMLAGKWIVEAAELEGMSAEKDIAIKASLSRTCDEARAAYGRLSEKQDRQCVFFGTVNQTKYLTDPTGNRRHWPVKIKKFDLEALRRDRDQLWAEAAVREAQGGSIQLPEALWAVAGEQQRARLAEDPWEERIAARLGDLQGIMRTSIVWNLLEIGVSNMTQKHGARVGAIMRSLGWIHGQKKVNGKVVQVYRRGFEDNTSAQPDEDKLWITTDWDRQTGRQLIQGGRLALPTKQEEQPVKPEQYQEPLPLDDVF